MPLQRKCLQDPISYHHSCIDTIHPDLLAGTFCNKLLPGINKNITWDSLILKLPLLSDRIYDYLAKRKITIMIRDVARFLLTVMPTELLGELGIPNNFVKDNRSEQQDVENQGRVWPNQVSGVIQRLALSRKVMPAFHHHKKLSTWRNLKLVVFTSLWLAWALRVCTVSLVLHLCHT